jgi:leucyl aminopeptidase
VTAPVQITFEAAEAGAVAELGGRIAVFLDETGRLDPAARRLDAKARGLLRRFAASEAFARMKAGDGHVLSFPSGLAAEALLVVKLPRRPSAAEARKAGAAIAAFNAAAPLAVVAGGAALTAEIALGLALKVYDFREFRTPDKDWKAPNAAVTFHVRDAEAVQAAYAPRAAVAEGVFFTRDLVNLPANVLTTLDFAERLEGLRDLGVEVEVLDEEELERLGMRTLLAVGIGSETPSRVVVMQWKGGGDEAPLALVGKGVVFDTGGISIKPAAGMEEMTCDMGGAGVVAGVMHTIAKRGAKANVVGLVGLVENMPDGRATRPGDIVRSMKGDTIEIINTDAEGRLVLADVLWYAQDRFQPRAMIDLATLTGAVVIALGHEMAGVFVNDDKFAGDILAAAQAEDEGAWRMPLAAAYDRQLKSRLADVANVGGRPGGSITAARFLARFVKEGLPWAHLDIAGVTLMPRETDLAPKGASGWGVRTLDRLIAARFEK